MIRSRAFAAGKRSFRVGSTFIWCVKFADRVSLTGSLKENRRSSGNLESEPYSDSSGVKMVELLDISDD